MEEALDLSFDRLMMMMMYNPNACSTFRVEETEGTGKVILVCWVMENRNRKTEATSSSEKLVLPTKTHVISFHTTVATVLATVRTCNPTVSISLKNLKITSKRKGKVGYLSNRKSFINQH